MSRFSMRQLLRELGGYRLIHMLDDTYVMNNWKTRFIYLLIILMIGAYAAVLLARLGTVKEVITFGVGHLDSIAIFHQYFSGGIFSVGSQFGEQASPANYIGIEFSKISTCE